MTTQGRSTGELSDLAELFGDEREYALPRASVDPRTRRARRRRAWIAALVVLVVLVGSVGAYVTWALTAPVSAPAVAVQAPDAPVGSAADIALPADGAAAVSVSGADEYLGAGASGVWLTSGTDEPRSIASITKVITALVVLDEEPLDGIDDEGPTITFSEADHDLYDAYYVRGATIAAMPAGSTMSLRDALSTMLIPSASNYAEAVSTWAFGSQGAFLSATRRWLADNGLAGTTIVEPTGLSARNTSTPVDLIAIGKLAAADPTIAAIAATPSLSVPGPGRLVNTNNLLGSDGVTGLKTGNLGAGSFSLLYTATLDVGTAQRLSVTGIMLGGGSRESVDRSVRALLDSIRAGFHQVPVATRGDELGGYSTPWGSTARIVVGENASLLTWSDTPITVTMETTTPTAYEDGEIVGTLTWSAGPNTVSVPVVIEGAITPPTEWWRLTHPGELGGE